MATDFAIAVNVNKEMMFGVPLVLMFGPDTGPPAAAPSTHIQLGS